MEYHLFNIKDLSEKQAEKCISLMSEERKEYIKKVTNPKRRIETVAGEWFAKTTVAKLLSLKTEDIILERDKKGKPFIKDRDVHISISHSGDFVAVAVDTKPIGIDIEIIKPIDLKIVKRVCSESDNRLLAVDTDSQKLINFLKIWTAKEAYFKKTGTGIEDMKSVSYKDINACHYFEENLVITVVK